MISVGARLWFIGLGEKDAQGGEKEELSLERKASGLMPVLGDNWHNWSWVAAEWVAWGMLLFLKKTCFVRKMAVHNNTSSFAV